MKNKIFIMTSPEWEAIKKAYNQYCKEYLEKYGEHPKGPVYVAKGIVRT